MRKDIRSDHDILEEEVIKPIKTKSTIDNVSMNPLSDDFENTQIQQEPSVPQLIKYKQQIRNENDRRLHRENLADLAKNQREKEQFVRSDLSTEPEEIQQQKLNDNGTLSQVVPDKIQSSTKLSHKPSVKSKEEEQILNDENVFQPTKHRRQRNKLSISRSNTPYMSGRYITDFRSSMRKTDENITCKVCGNVISREDNTPRVDSHQGSGKFVHFKKKKYQN